LLDLGRHLYLDLLIRTLANTIYQDGAWVPNGTEVPFDSAQRAAGADWPKMAHTMVGLRRLENLRELVQSTVDEAIPGDFIETGVWRGGCCILMRGVLAASGVTDRRVYVADSFEGFPPPNPDARHTDKTLGLLLHASPQLAIGLAEVKQNFARYNLLDDQVVFVKGFFRDTLPGLDAGPLALIRLDCDLYEPTADALSALYPRLSSGGYVIVDDYNWIPECRAAVTSCRSSMAITAPIHEIDGNAVWWRKP
jgi:O-methyltransferase